MGDYVPKKISEDRWKKLDSQKDYAVRCGPKDSVGLRLGTGLGLYYAITASKSGGLNLFVIDYETGEATAEDPFPAKKTITIGRVADCHIKAKHAIASRKHVELTLDGNVLIVRDLGSTNGTCILVRQISFEIQDYIDKHPIDEKHEGTLDVIHEEFGPALDDFLKRYIEKKGR